jgi:hypothetical protein
MLEKPKEVRKMERFSNSGLGLWSLLTAGSVRAEFYLGIVLVGLAAFGLLLV